MGENIRENIPLPNSDPERRPELTRTISNYSSSSSFSFTTLDASEELPLCCSHVTLGKVTYLKNSLENKKQKNSLENANKYWERALFLHSQRKNDVDHYKKMTSQNMVKRSLVPGLEGASTEWTNEKHNLYLDSLETSFVNELYHSMRLRDWHQQKNARGTRSLQEVSFKTQNSSDRFMVVQDGCLQINLRQNESLMESTANSHVTVRSPCRCHSTLAGKSCTVSSPKTLTLKKLHASARSSEQNLVCHQDLVGSITEVSGQNFVDEDHGGKLSNASKPKRLKRVAADASSNDQIVPSGNFDTKEMPNAKADSILSVAILVVNGVRGNATVGLWAKVHREEIISVQRYALHLLGLGCQAIRKDSLQVKSTLIIPSGEIGQDTRYMLMLE
ncbi:cold regulated gene 27, partial [Prunus dulcis]